MRTLLLISTNIIYKKILIQEEVQRTSSFGDESGQFHKSDRNPLRKVSNNESRDSFFPYSKQVGNKIKGKLINLSKLRW